MLEKSKLNSPEILISKTLTDSVISLFNLIKFNLFMKQCYHIPWSVEKIQEAKIQKVAKTKKGRITLLSKCIACGSKKSKFIKQQELSKLLSSLGINSFSRSSFTVVALNKLTPGIKWMK